MAQQTLFTFFQNPIIDFVSRLAVVENSPRHCHVQAFWSRSEVFWRFLCWFWSRKTSIFGDFVLIDGVMAVSWPNVNFLAKRLYHFVDWIVVMTLRSQFLFWAIGRGSGRSTGTTVNAALWNARVDILDKTWIIKTITWWLGVPEQRVAIGFGSYGELVVAVVLICTRMSEILVVGLILVNVVEIVREEAAIGWRWSPIEWSTTNALKIQLIEKSKKLFFL